MKVAIIGIGTVGSAVATAVKNTGLVHEIVLFDRDAVRARAAAEDLGHAASFGFDVNISAAGNYRAIRGSDIVIIAAGKNQKPGETRTDLLQNNAAVIRDIVPRVMANVDSKRVILIIVTNPLDVMVMLAQELSELPPEPAQCWTVRGCERYWRGDLPCRHNRFIRMFLANMVTAVLSIGHRLALVDWDWKIFVAS